MAIEITLPKLGLTMQEGTIEEWLPATGAAVAVGDILLRLATDKVDVDVEAEAAGFFHPAVGAGTTLPPGAVIGWLLEAGETPPASVTAAAPAAPAEAAPAATPVTTPDATPAAPGRHRASPNARRVAALHGVDVRSLRGSGPGGRVVSEDVEDAVAAGTIPASPAASPAAAFQEAAATRFASPLVRRRAETLGVDLAGLTPTGVGGRVRMADVDAAARSLGGPAAAGAAAANAAIAAGPQAGDIVPLTGMRGAIARSMHASLQEMAQLTHGYEADVTELVAVREKLRAELAGSDQRVPTLHDFVLRASALALVRHPGLNASVLDDGVHLHTEVHVGFAAAVPDGLLVPVVRDADELSLGAIATETVRLAAAAREGRLGFAEAQGATFTISSLGGYGVDFFTPVVNPGNVAILGIGRQRDGVSWDGETPRRTRVITLSLTFDHRAVDGAPAAEFLRTVAGLLGRPLMLLAS